MSLHHFKPNTVAVLCPPPVCKVCGAALNLGERHKHATPGWKPRYDDLEGALEGYQTEPNR